MTVTMANASMLIFKESSKCQTPAMFVAATVSPVSRVVQECGAVRVIQVHLDRIQKQR